MMGRFVLTALIYFGVVVSGTLVFLGFGYSVRAVALAFGASELLALMIGVLAILAMGISFLAAWNETP